MHRALRAAALFTALASLNPTSALDAQDAPPLTLEAAQQRAAAVSPMLAAARASAAAAAATARQAGAFPNPTLSIQREQTESGAVRNSQTISSVDQPIELGLRGARRDAAAHRRAAAEAQLADVETQLAFDVAFAFAEVLAADRRAALADSAATAFERARRVSDDRLAAGDVSGYADRRIRLEAARYAILRAEAHVERHRARLALAALLSESEARVEPLAMQLATPAHEPRLAADADALVRAALSQRGDLRAARLDVDASRADATLASRERLPVPVLTAGLKTEAVGGFGELTGFAAGIAFALPLWDRRAGSIAAALSVVSLRSAEATALALRVTSEVRIAAEAARVVDEQLAALGDVFDVDAAQAIRSAEVAYAEGELSLVEWLDAVRAYHEAATALADLQTESLIRRAALLRAVGRPLTGNAP